MSILKPSKELYDKAVKIVSENNDCSVSFLWSKLRGGYTKTIDILDKMEADGLISKPNYRGLRKLTNLKIKD